MSNLIRELGVAYVRDRFAECMFYDADKKAVILDGRGRWPENQVGVTEITGPATKPKLVQKGIDYDYFSSLSVFSVPTLGWRAAAKGRFLAYYNRNNRSYHRAIAPNILNRKLSGVTELLVETGNLSLEHYTRPNVVASLIMYPEYMGFREGLKQLRNGKIISFCINPNIAVMPGVEDTQDIYYNTSRVATVHPDDTVSSYVPAFSLIMKELEQ